MTKLRISVIGPADGASPKQIGIAREVGYLIAEKDAQLVCGGLGGVMKAACQGAIANHGVTIGLLPGDKDILDNDHLSVMLPTGLGELRNGLVVRAGHAAICIGGSWGTLSEVAFALRSGRTCVGIEPWEIMENGNAAYDGIKTALTAADAVRIAIGAAKVWQSK